MRRQPAKTSWSLPGGDQKVSLPNGQETTLAELNRFRWSTGIGLAPSVLRPHQMPLYEADIALPSQQIGFELCARRYGKSFEKLSLGVETAIQNRDCAVRFAFPAKNQGLGIVEGNLRKILRTCPPDLAPSVTMADGLIRFPNGSQIVVAGTDDKDQREKLRGNDALLIIVDEAGSHKDIDYLIEDILAPQIDGSDGKLIMITTPPRLLDHPTVCTTPERLSYMDRARRDGTLIIKTIKDNTYYTREKMLAICARANRLAKDHTDVPLILDNKLEGSPSWEREYMCRLVADRTMRVCPDFKDADPFVETFVRPKHTTHYVFLDQGGVVDPFTAIFVSHDFQTGKIYVEEEWAMKHQPTDAIILALKAKERSLKWGPQVRRFCNDPRGGQQRLDMSTRGYQVTQGAKSEGAEMEADRLNLALRAGKIVVHARCESLRKQLQYGLFKISESGGKVDFERSSEYGHLDGIAALTMGLRHVDWRRDVTPADEFNNADYFVPRGMKKPLTETQRAVWGMFQGIKN